MTPLGEQPYIGPVMRSEALSLYIREVLGAEVPRPEPVADLAPVIVVTEELTEFTRNLLNKILSSISLAHWRHQTLEQEPVPAVHRLIFGSDGTPGRKVVGQEVHWVMPKLSEMLGEGPEVTAHKRAVWNLLQGFQREFKVQ